MSLRLAAVFRRAERRRQADDAPAEAARLCVSDLLRLHGMPLGKRDYLGRLRLKT